MVYLLVSLVLRHFVKKSRIATFLVRGRSRWQAISLDVDIDMLDDLQAPSRKQRTGDLIVHSRLDILSADK